LKDSENEKTPESLDFVRSIVAEDLKTGKWQGRVATRFPPEPNGFLHIGHAKSICLNFGIAAEFGGTCNLRFDDTNPVKEEDQYVAAIKEDIKWLGWDWHDRLYFASDYFEQMYEFAVELIKTGKAYVCDLTADEIKDQRGSLTSPGTESPYRNRSIEENLDLFERMRKGEFPDGSRTLRAKIDMASANLNMRDPVMYRILRATHHRTGDDWCIYPMYDWAHGLEDSVEKITHSICTLEFENHRPLYDWFLDELGVHHSQQIEFARLNLTYTVMSKRKLLRLYPEDKTEYLDAVNNPENPAAGTRSVPFSRELYIEQDDFMENPPKKFYRLAPGREVRLRYAYFITCNEVIKDENGNPIELHCTYDPATRGGDAPDGRKVKSTLHWVSAPHSIPAEVRLYDHLFTKENPDDAGEGKDFTDNLNPDSLETLTNCRLEPSLANTAPGERFQFERLGYFCADSDRTADNLPVFNRTVTLRDTWAKIQKNQKKRP